MTTITDPSTTALASDDQAPRRRKWSGAEYDELVALGKFARQRVELLNGEIYEMSPMNDPHALAIKLANLALIRSFPIERFIVQVQCPMRLSEDSRPEPDLAVLAGSPRNYPTHPTSALLIVEVADTTLDYDRQHKGPIYANSKIQEYWIVNLRERIVEVHRNPLSRQVDPRYEEIRAYSASEVVSPLSAPEAKIAVSDLLP